MCLFRKLSLCFLSVLIANVSCAGAGVSIQDAIGFPEKEENDNLKNKEDRQPVFLPSMCPENELYYPGDQKDDWICDCRPSHIYHPTSDKCWPGYRRGPCPEEQYLILRSDSVIPVCAPNPCKVDGYVPWIGKCERLGSTAPCGLLYPNAYALGVNATTLVVSCVKLNIESRFTEVRVPEISPLACPPGCKRSVNRVCVISL